MKFTKQNLRPMPRCHGCDLSAEFWLKIWVAGKLYKVASCGEDGECHRDWKSAFKPISIVEIAYAIREHLKETT